MGTYADAHPTSPVEGERARLKGPSLRAIARELGISRVTVRKYAYAEQPPTKKLSAKERAKLVAIRKSATVAE